MAQGCQIEGCQLAAVGQLEWFTSDRQRHRVVFCAEHRNLLWDNIESVIRQNSQWIKRDPVPIEHTGTVEQVAVEIETAFRNSLSVLQTKRPCKYCKRTLLIGAYEIDDQSDGTMKMRFCSGACRKKNFSKQKSKRKRRQTGRQAAPTERQSAAKTP